MKKGFIGVLILLVLEKNPSYGYKITKEIKNRSLGIWNPSSSTMYTILKDLTKKKLIEIYKEQKDIRTKKIYRITQKGKESLKLILQKQKFIEETVETFKSKILNNNNSGSFRFGPLGFFFQRLDERSDAEKLEFLKIHKLRVENKIKQLNKDLKIIIKNIAKLEQKKEK